jgi:hypothetical protein
MGTRYVYTRFWHDVFSFLFILKYFGCTFEELQVVC